MNSASGNLISIPAGEEKITFQGKMIEVVSQVMRIGTKEVVFEKARRSPGVRLLIQSASGKILLTKEYRNEVSGWDYRFPGGKVYDSLPEYNHAVTEKKDLQMEAQKAAIKEAGEEVGIEVTDIAHFYTSKCGATVEWDLYYFVVEVPNEITGKQKLESGENIEIAWLSHQEAMNIALSGEMSEDRSVAVLMLFISLTHK